MCTLRLQKGAFGSIIAVFEVHPIQATLISILTGGRRGRDACRVYVREHLNWTLTAFHTCKVLFVRYGPSSNM